MDERRLRSLQKYLNGGEALSSHQSPQVSGRRYTSRAHSTTRKDRSSGLGFHGEQSHSAKKPTHGSLIKAKGGASHPFNSPLDLKKALRLSSPDNVRLMAGGAVVNNLVLRDSREMGGSKSASKARRDEVEALKQGSISEARSEYEREEYEHVGGQIRIHDPALVGSAYAGISSISRKIDFSEGRPDDLREIEQIPEISQFPGGEESFKKGEGVSSDVRINMSPYFKLPPDVPEEEVEQHVEGGMLFKRSPKKRSPRKRSRERNQRTTGERLIFRMKPPTKQGGKDAARKSPGPRGGDGVS